MSEWIKLLFVKIFGANSWIATLIISMIPIVELRGAIPFGSATAFWGENALPLWLSFLVSVVGSTFVCVILTFAFWPIFKWLKRTKIFRRLALFIENKLSKNSENIDKKTKDEKSEKKIFWLKFCGVFAFVAIPLPLTGVWTGTCLGLFLGLSKMHTMLAVIPGNIVAGLIMTIVSYFFADNTLIVLLAFLALVVVFVIYEVIKSLIKKHKAKKQGAVQEKEIEEVAADVAHTETENVETENIEAIDETEKVTESQDETETAETKEEIEPASKENDKLESQETETK